MKRKITVIILAIVCSLTCMVGLTACSETNDPTHAHTHRYVLKSDSTYHWLQCDSTDCTEKIKNRVAHDTKGDYGACAVCGYRSPDEIIAQNPAYTLKFAQNRNGDGYSVIGTDFPTANIIIPREYNGKPVTEIGNKAFYNISYLTNVTIPNSITSIGESAFDGCWEISNIIVPDSVTNIGDKAFRECIKLNSITLSDHVADIGANAFEGCRKLTEIIIPNSVINIGSAIFKDCASLINVTLSSNIQHIKFDSFKDCTSLTTITVPDSVISVGSSAFCGCNSLEDITLPNSVSTIMDLTFYGCSSLNNITIPNSVVSIGLGAFHGCDKLESINIPFIGNELYTDEKQVFHSIFSLSNDVDTASIPTTLITVNVTGGTKVYDNAFYGCKNITNISLPNSITHIANNAFYYCNSLTNIIIDDGNDIYSSNGNCIIEKETKTLLIGFNCSVIPNDGSITNIADRAFYGCSKLTNVTIPDSVTRIGKNAFAFCDNLEEITLPFVGAELNGTANRNFGYLFGDSSSWNSDNRVPLSLKTVVITGGDIAMGAFANCNKINSIILGESVTIICSLAFLDCTNLTNVIIPNSVVTIDDGAFRGCSNLTVYCKSQTKPNEWNDNWSRGVKDVVWGYEE